ncbi:MAG TPA: glycosyltransferase [Bacteroidales bacterium]|nr:glycosyltransferase [Bacteroidales bacterium]HOL97023.1 glycosyltransferase [Bacteroidales bacterium]HOM36260.1 glycosyltransferase [Bacteroidales bacterium]HPD23816.1 glycosyltransferase [Bacteroidales bacterium]HRS98708.1 glycosyltransferase [Bacteroidales bacterium]
MKICHITTVHPRFDVRIFHKECQSLNDEFKVVSLIVADGLGNTVANQIQIYDIGKAKSRKERFVKTVHKALKKALSLKADVYHLHDPELLRIIKKLKKSGAAVIYDAHEDLPRQILNKPYIPKLLRNFISLVIEKYENKKAKIADGIITATPHIRERFLKINPNTTDINNFPKINDILYHNNWDEKELAIAYIGGIFKTRGILETLEAIKDSNIKLLLAGKFSPESFETECRNHPGWKNVNYFGFLDRNGINNILKQARIGMVILENTPSYIVSLPVKMFEYMAAGLPVMASDFELWKSIIETENCGICVNQKDVNEINQKLNQIIFNTELLKKMGKNGRNAVINKYNWSLEEKKLISFYKNLIKNNNENIVD